MNDLRKCFFSLKLNEVMIIFNKTHNSPDCVAGTIDEVIALSVIIRYLQAPVLQELKKRDQLVSVGMNLGLWDGFS